MQSGNIVQIKGMVCGRCISIVQAEIELLGIHPEKVDLRRVTFSGSDFPDDKRLLNDCLSPFGFSVLENRTEILLHNTINLIYEVYSGDFAFPEKFRFSDYVTSMLSKEYDSLSSQFSLQRGITIEKYIINYRIERVKYFLSSQKIHLSEIAFKLGFSSVAHLSRQFKTETGITATSYKALAYS